MAMSRVMAVAFTQNGRLHYLDPGDERYEVGEWVLHPTTGGPEVCRVVWAPEEVDSDVLDAIPPCAGRASDADLERDDVNRARKARAQDVARELVAAHELDMKILGVDIDDRDTEHGEVIAFYFSAEHRVDFRALVPALARTLGARVDLRQVGARDATRITGGIGACGRELCCSTFLTDFEPVSWRLPRDQGLAGNPLQIAGACGRLMCCLKYEQPAYLDFARRAPAIGTKVSTASGEGTVVGHYPPGETVSVRGANGEVQRCPLASVCVRAAGRKKRWDAGTRAAHRAPASPDAGDHRP